jgi:hypothetical protein
VYHRFGYSFIQLYSRVMKMQHFETQGIFCGLCNLWIVIFFQFTEHLQFKTIALYPYMVSCIREVCRLILIFYFKVCQYFCVNENVLTASISLLFFIQHCVFTQHRWSTILIKEREETWLLSSLRLWLCLSYPTASQFINGSSVTAVNWKKELLSAVTVLFSILYQKNCKCWNETNGEIHLDGSE